MSTAPLRFEAFSAYEVVVPARREILAAPEGESAHKESATWDRLPVTLIEGRTSDGIVAVGEAPRGLSREKIEEFLRHLLGVNLHRWHPFNADLSLFGQGGMRQAYPIRTGESPVHGPAAMLYESLWLDAMGKACNAPAHLLLGGKVRDRVRVDAWANRPTAEGLCALIAQAAEAGFTGIKLKCGPDGDTLRALATLLPDLPPDFHFTVDAMNALRSLRESAPLLNALLPLGSRLLLEDPFVYERPDDWVEARRRFGFPIACHARCADRFRWALEHRAADVLNFGQCASEFLHLASVAEFHQYDCWLGSSLELGVAQMLRLHVASAARACVLPSDLQSAWVRESTLVQHEEHGWCYHGGALSVPDAPGLGVSLDHAAIPHYLVHQWELA